MSKQTLKLVRIFISNRPPGKEFTTVACGRHLQNQQGYDPTDLLPSLKRMQTEGALTRIDDLKGKRWAVAGRKSSPSDGKLGIVGLAGGDLRKKQGRLAERFLIPPFSVLDGRNGSWRSRKQQWMRIGLRSEEGRDGNLLGGWSEFSVWDLAGTSIFDPVLCEASYLWYCPPGGQVVDPFAGGSVRGIVAGEMGLRYWGSDLRQVQVDANRKQAGEVKPKVAPTWVVGDSSVALLKSPRADFVFSCPPYGDLEKYSEDSADLSNMPHAEMLAKYAEILGLAAARLKDDRFFVLVVGDFRDKEGILRDFVSSTIRACKRAGLRFYNDCVLMTSLASAPLRAAKQMHLSRKVARIHQHVLVFVKGDPLKAAAACRGATVITEGSKEEE